MPSEHTQTAVLATVLQTTIDEGDALSADRISRLARTEPERIPLLQKELRLVRAAGVRVAVLATFGQALWALLADALAARTDDGELRAVLLEGRYGNVALAPGHAEMPLHPDIGRVFGRRCGREDAEHATTADIAFRWTILYVTDTLYHLAYDRGR